MKALVSAVRTTLADLRGPADGVTAILLPHDARVQRADDEAVM
jgi:hypothetical protein